MWLVGEACFDAKLHMEANVALILLLCWLEELSSPLFTFDVFEILLFAVGKHLLFNLFLSHSLECFCSR